MENNNEEMNLKFEISKENKAKIISAFDEFMSAVLIYADGKKVDLWVPADNLKKTINSVLKDIVDKKLETYVSSDLTSKSLIEETKNAINDSKSSILKSMLSDPCNRAYFKLAQKKDRLKQMQATIYGLNDAVVGLKPRYFEIANEEFEKLFRNIFSSFSRQTEITIVEFADCEFADDITVALQNHYDEKYYEVVVDKAMNLEESNEEMYGQFASDFEDSMNYAVGVEASLLDGDALLSLNSHHLSGYDLDEIKEKMKVSPISNLTLQRFAVLVKGTELTDEELKASQSWLSDKNVENYDVAADLLLARENRGTRK